MSRMKARYRCRCDAGAAQARARAIAIEQSVEMPLSAITDDAIRTDVVGEVEAVEEIGQGLYEIRIALAARTAGRDAGQLVNMLFGNTSLHDDVTLQDLELPPGLAAAFPGPGHGLEGLRRRCGAEKRALTCATLKPQGLSPAALADLALALTQGGVDYVKDDHGLADQDYSPFAARVEAIAARLARAGLASRYVPSLSGDLDDLRRQVGVARDCGVDTVMVAPMIAGLSNVARLVRENPDVAFLAHPSLGGASRIAPPLLIGKLFRLIGADAVIFPHHGGRFGYSAETCRELAVAARHPWHGMRPSVPTPAGGMTLGRVAEILDFYGSEVMLLLGGALLDAREGLSAAASSFVDAVRHHGRE